MNTGHRLWAMVIGGLILVWAEAAEARQAPGYAEITSPSPGSAVQGIVTIQGSANHPSFVEYDLAFGYSDDPTDTWFPLGPRVTSPVVDGALGLWDTGKISPGVYVLRLRVSLSNGTILESQVRVSVGLPTASPVPGAPTSTKVPVLPTTTPLPPAPLPVEPADADPVASAMTIGAAMAVAGFVLLGVYLALSRALAVWLGGLRMRRVLRGPHRARARRS
ncbi:MAG TPA: hypothetical protein VFI11_01940 [Anaerolineales bacterium]|nr:hypothetical protein [Anaerolineales bacterium]